MGATRKITRLRKIIYISGLLVSSILLLIALLIIDNSILRILICAGAVAIPVSAFTMDKVHNNYVDKLLVSLSDLINTIIDMKEESIFSETEDNLLSKLQTQIVKLTGILKAHNKAIEKEKGEIQSLISDISHQLKTSIASVKLYGELLIETDITEIERREYGDALIASLDKLTFLTESMIKMSRLESGIIQLKPMRADLNLLLLEALKQIYYKAANKNVTIVFEPKESIWITLDINWTREAIFNILDNAVKYSKVDGTVWINVSEYNIYCRIDISDNGQGIEEEEQSKIFKRFYRGRGSEDKEGVGIGLYLARKVITEQNGYIKVISEGKTGSTFSVFMPM